MRTHGNPGATGLAGPKARTRGRTGRARLVARMLSVTLLCLAAAMLDTTLRGGAAANSSAAEPNSLQLVDGTPRMGRLEIFHDGQWGTVCNDYFGTPDATVACRQLGYSGGAIRYGTSIPHGRQGGPIWLDDLGCTGSETVLAQCPHPGFGRANCLHFEDVKLSCDPPVVHITTPSTVPVAENRTLVALLEAISDRGAGDASLSWTIAGGDDRDEFTLTSGGMLAFKALNDRASPDDANADGSYEVSVRVTDGAGYWTMADLSVTLQAADATAPTLSSAAADLATIVLKYDDVLDNSSVPATSAFSVSVNSASRTVIGVSVKGRAVLLTLASAILPGQTATVSYVVPTDASAARIQDASGNDAAGFTNRDVSIPPEPLTGFTLVDTVSGQDLTTLQDGGSVDLGNYENRLFSIRADPASGSKIGSVSLESTGALTHSHTDDVAPYTLFGEVGPDIAGQSLPVGSHTLRATAYSGAGLTGTALQVLEVSFTVTEPEVSIAAGTSPVSEGAAAAFTLSRSGSTGAALTVDVQVTETESMLGATLPSTVTFAAGAASQTLNVSTTDDNVVESSSTVTVAIADGARYAVSSSAGSAEVEVTDDDTGAFSIAADPASIAEGGDATVTVAISNSTLYADDQTIDLTVSGTAAATEYGIRDGAGQPLSSPFSLTFPAGETSVTATVRALIDVIAESAETIVIAGAHEGDSIGSATVTIEANSAHDPLAGFTLVDTTSDVDLLALRSNVVVDLGDYSTPEFGLRADPAIGATIGSVGLELARSGEVVASSTDNLAPYSLHGKTGGVIDGAALPAGSYTITAKVYPEADLGGTLQQTLSVSFTVTAPEVSIEAAKGTVPEGSDIVFTMTRAGPATTSLTVGLSWAVVTDGSVFSGSRPSSVTFAPGVNTRMMHVPVTQDTVSEAMSMVTVSLVPGPGYVVSADKGSSSVTVQDDDVVRLALAVDRPWIVEGKTSTITLGLKDSVTLPQDATITLDLSASTADSSDYTLTDDNGVTLSAPYSVVLPAGESNVELTLASVADDTDESDETVTITASYPGVPTRTARIVIADTPDLKPLRLVDGDSNTQGRLEVFHDGEWGTVCDDGFGNTEAVVVCRQLGYSTGVMLLDSGFPNGQGKPIWMDDVQCDGTERGLSDCKYRTQANCLHFEDVMLSCGSPDPVITTSSLITVPANRRHVAKLQAMVGFVPMRDLAWTITGGDDSSQFTLSRGGVLTFDQVNDHGSPDDADTDGDYEVTVRVTGRHGSNAEALLTVRLAADDSTAPGLISATVQGGALSLAFDEELDEGSVPPASAFAVTVGGASRSVTRVSVTRDEVVLTLASVVMPNDAVTLSYIVPTGSGASPIQDRAGNDAAAISDMTVQVATSIFTGFVLRDTVSNADVLELRDGTVVDLGSYVTNHFTIRAGTAEGVPVGSVRLRLSGAQSSENTENSAPYTLYPSYGSVYRGAALAVGDYTLTATAYPGRERGGTPLETSTVSFSVTRPVVMFSTVVQDPIEEGEAATFVLTRTGSVVHMKLEVIVTENGRMLEEVQTTRQVEFDENEDSGMLAVMTTDDSDKETPSTITVSIPTSANYDLETGASSAQITVQDNDAPVFTVSADPSAIEEGQSSTVTVAITNPVIYADPQTITLDLSGGTADAADFVVTDSEGQDLAAPYSLTLPAGHSKVSAAISAVKDTEAEVEETIAVAVSHGEDAIGTATVTIAANDAPTGLPAISGTAQVGETLTADVTGIADADGLDGVTFSYQWVSNDGTDDTDIADATQASYAVAVGDVGKTLKVRVTYTDDRGSGETLTSEATAAVAAAPPAAPRNLALAAPEGREGELAVSWAAPASDGGDPVTGYRVQWKSGTEEYDGSASSTRQAETDAATLGHRIAGLANGARHTVRVLAVNGAGAGEAAEAAATPRDRVAPTLSSATVAGATLTLEFSEALRWSAPAADAFSVVAAGAARGVDAVRMGRRSVRLTLASAVSAGETVTVSYAAPSDASAARIEDRAGNAAAGFAGAAVTLEAEQDRPWDLGAAVGADGVTLTWRDPNTHDSRGLYHILRHRPEQGETAPQVYRSYIAIEDRTFTDGKVKPGVLYVYAVRAVKDIFGALGPASDAVAVRMSSDLVPAAPTMSSVAVSSDPGDGVYGIGERIEVTVAFDEAVTVTGSPRIELDIGGEARPAAYESATGSEVVFGYTIVAEDSDTDGIAIGSDRLTVNGGSIRNASDNDANLSHDALAAQGGHRVDGIRPALSEAVVDGATLTLAFGEALDEGSAPGADAFAVTVAGASRGVDGVAVAGSAVTLTLGSAVRHGETVTVGYTVPDGEDAAPIRDLAGNAAAALSGQAVTNETVANPTVSKVEITSTPAQHGTYAGGETIEVSVTFSEPVTVTGTPGIRLRIGTR